MEWVVVWREGFCGIWRYFFFKRGDGSMKGGGEEGL